MENSDDIYLRSAQVARLLHVTPKTVSRWATLGMLRAVKTLGGHRRFSQREVLALREKLTMHPVNAPEGTE